MDAEWIPGYRHIRVLGEGATGRVVHAEHLETGTHVAIKYLSDRLVSDSAFLDRFREEARLLGELDDPNLVRFFEYVESAHGAAIVMELVDGVSLAAMLDAEGPTQAEAALTVLKGSLLGLAAAHAVGVVHRDYKPANVLVHADGTSRLADFGVAVRAGAAVPAAGTPAYMAPEQWGGGPVGPAADVYAATAVFYECLTGRHPYAARTIPQLALAHRSAQIPAEQVAEPLRGLVEHGLAKDPGERPESVRAFLQELEAVAFGAYGTGWEERGRNQLKERAALLALLFPRNRAPEGGVTSVGLTELGGGRRWGGRKAGAAAAAGAIGLLLIGGGTTVIYVGNSGSDRPLASASSPAGPGDLDPSGDPSADPSLDPSAEPSPSPSGTGGSPTPGPSPVTSSPAPGSTPPGDDGTGPDPVPTTTKPATPPTKVTTPPVFAVTGVSVTVGPPNANGIGDFTVTVRTTGKPQQTVTLTISSGNVKPRVSSATLAAGSSYVFSSSYSGAWCRDATINVSTSPNGSGTGTYSAADDPDCVQIGSVPGRTGEHGDRVNTWNG